MWENYIPGQSPTREVKISKDLYTAIVKYSEDKKCTIQHIFDISLITLWRIYNGNTESNDPANHVTENKVRQILIDNPMPGDLNSKKIYVGFSGDMTFKWVCKLCQLYMCKGIIDFIRRSISFYLRKQGYVDDSIAKQIKEKET